MWMNPGIHILLDGKNTWINFSDIDIDATKKYLSSCILESGMSILWELFYDFKEPKWAFTGIFLLGESHFSLHTFPEDRYITVDLYTCNMTRDFSENAMTIITKIIEHFEIQNPLIRTIQR